MHIKLNELLLAAHGANNKVINLEEASEQELIEAKEKYRHLVEDEEKSELENDLLLSDFAPPDTDPRVSF